MELGDPTTDRRPQRSRVDVALDAFETALNGLIGTVEAGGLDQLTANQKVAVWQRFETFRNRLPLIDHSLIADAEATDLAGTEAASRVRAAAAVGPRTSMLGALQISPHSFHAEGLDLPHQRRRSTGVDTALVDRQATTPPNQRTHPAHPRPTPTTPAPPTATT
jgi:hypothetical protein